MLRTAWRVASVSRKSVVKQESRGGSSTTGRHVPPSHAAGRQQSSKGHDTFQGTCSFQGTTSLYASVNKEC